MRVALIATLTGLTLLLTSCTHTKKNSALTAEQLSLYRSAFISILQQAKHPLNVEDTTDSFEPEEWDRDHCLKGIHLPTAPTGTHHTLPPETFTGLPAHLVHSIDYHSNSETIKEGIISFSEIAYTPEHTRAVFTYTFYCGGGLCGGGGAVIFDLNQGTWSQSSTRCEPWIS